MRAYARTARGRLACSAQCRADARRRWCSASPICSIISARDDLRYSAAARELSGRDVDDRRLPLAMRTARVRACCWSISRASVPTARRSPAPSSRCPAHRAPFRRRARIAPFGCVGRLDYGFRIDAGVASILRIEEPPSFRWKPAREATDPWRPPADRRPARRCARRPPDRRRHHHRRAAAGRKRHRRRQAASTPTDRLLIPGLVNAHTHATVALGKGMADRWSLELLLNAYRLDRGRAHARAQVSLGPHRRARDGAQGLHRLLRPGRRNPGAVGRGHQRGRAAPTPTSACARRSRR